MRGGINLRSKHAVARWLQDEVQEPGTEFKPNLVNTVCFLVQFIIQLITFCVNYQGPPFNASIQNTTALRVTFFWGSIFWAVLSLDLIPSITQSISLVRPLCFRNSLCPSSLENPQPAQNV